MSRRHCVPLLALACCLPLSSVKAQDTNGPTLKTRWAAQVSPTNALPEYPRPQMVRDRWVNLNGSWDYAIHDATTLREPTTFDGSILVPYPVESQLSGVQLPLKPDQVLWYHRTFHAPALRTGEHLLLHFGAVDWQATVEINGHTVGIHEGGYVPFTYDITDALNPAADTQSITVRVWDPTDGGETVQQPHGKQTLHPGGISYTAVSGIWQTVWLEPVPAAAMTSLDIVPDVDASSLKVVVHADGVTGHDRVTVTVAAPNGGANVASETGGVDDTITLHIGNPHLWSPDDPYLYDLTVHLSSGDAVRSYAGMRKISLCKASGSPYNRLCLNNKPLFELGMLDQGWWPDGLYTAPTDSALIYDLAETKALGFNMLRKHIKVEPDRWYYYADKMGVLVWQDMPQADNQSIASRGLFAREGRWMMDALRNHPSIVMWVVFNEGWGQHDTKWYGRWVKAYDPTRLVNLCTGCDAEGGGDVIDAHEYGDAIYVPIAAGASMPESPIDPRARANGEFGGIAADVAGHRWSRTQGGGEAGESDLPAFWAHYQRLFKQIRAAEDAGLSAVVYTQVSDVEDETNGVMTYDRAVVKLPPEAVALNKSLVAP